MSHRVKAAATKARIEEVRETIAELRSARFCGPSDDLEEIFAVTVGYRFLVIKLQRLTRGLLHETVASHLNAVDVEPHDLYSALDAKAEIEVLILDIEEAIEALPQDESSGVIPNPDPLPIAVCSIVGEALGSSIYHHKTLDRLFYEAGATGAVPEENCVTKCQTWLKRIHDEVGDPISFVGRLIEEFMDVDVRRYNDQELGRVKIREVLARQRLSYSHGAIVRGTNEAFPAESLVDQLREKGLDSVDKELKRSLESIVDDPPAAITAACSIIESVCKVYIEDNELELPGNQDITHLWRTVSRHIGFDPGSREDNDMKKVLSGLVSVVGGIGALRTHVGSAHGRGRKAYRPQPRHARLAVHAAHTIVAFLLETSDAR